jgi:hypothetical protein
VLTGPVEATVFGNVLVQARSHGEIRSLSDIRSVSRASSEIVQHDPADASAWSEARGRFAEICKRSRGS